METWNPVGSYLCRPHTSRAPKLEKFIVVQFGGVTKGHCDKGDQSHGDAIREAVIRIDGEPNEA